MRGDRSEEIPTIVIQLRKFWWFFFPVAYVRWSPMRGRVPHEGSTHKYVSQCTRFCNCGGETDHDARKMMSLFVYCSVWNKDL